MIEMSFLSTLTGSFSSPAAGNPTVAMVEAAYRDLGLDARYLNCDVSADCLGDAVRGAVAMGWVGFNCSLPHKLAVIEHLDEQAESARVIGAVNCVELRSGRLVGHNTDGQGFVESLREVTDPTGTRVVVLGAGGAARAVAVELALAGAAELLIVNRTVERAEELAGHIEAVTGVTAGARGWDGEAEIPGGTDLVINATSIGLFPDTASPPIDVSTLDDSMLVADVIPNPADTPFLSQARARGCLTLDGLGMLVDQGRIGIRLWTGLEADPTVMRRALAEAFT